MTSLAPQCHVCSLDRHMRMSGVFSFPFDTLLMRGYVEFRGGSFMLFSRPSETNLGVKSQFFSLRERKKESNICFGQVETGFPWVEEVKTTGHGGQERAKEGQIRANWNQKLAKIYKAKKTYT